jgi:hypothetical protein
MPKRQRHAREHGAGQTTTLYPDLVSPEFGINGIAGGA